MHGAMEYREIKKNIDSFRIAHIHTNTCTYTWAANTILLNHDPEYDLFVVDSVAWNNSLAIALTDWASGRLDWHTLHTKLIRRVERERKRERETRSRTQNIKERTVAGWLTWLSG